MSGLRGSSNYRLFLVEVNREEFLKVVVFEVGFKGQIDLRN